MIREGGISDAGSRRLRARGRSSVLLPDERAGGVAPDAAVGRAEDGVDLVLSRVARAKVDDHFIAGGQSATRGAGRTGPAGLTRSRRGGRGSGSRGRPRGGERPA